MSFKLITCIVDRANYGRLLPLLRVLEEDQRFLSQTCFTGTTLLPSYNLLNKDRYTKHGIYADYMIEIEKDVGSLSAMTETISNGISKISKLFMEQKPDAVILIGDRYEALSCAIAASYTNNFLIHIQGGELSGSIDETTRHCITKMAHLHFPATHQSADVIRQLGEDPHSIHISGCPVTELLNEQTVQTNDILIRNSVSSQFIDLICDRQVYAVCIIHPVTTEIENTSQIASITSKALSVLKIPTLWILPNSDPGTNAVSDSILESEYIEKLKNIEPIDFQLLISKANMLIGNSSSFIRDSSLYGVPVINLGKRQLLREHGPNVHSVKQPTFKLLLSAIKFAISNIDRKESNIYKGTTSSPSKHIANSIFDFLKDPLYDGFQKKFFHLPIKN